MWTVISLVWWESQAAFLIAHGDGSSRKKMSVISGMYILMLLSLGETIRLLMRPSAKSFVSTFTRLDVPLNRVMSFERCPRMVKMREMF